jgi:O-antigen/teichoic acid export membrane protein
MAVDGPTEPDAQSEPAADDALDEVERASIGRNITALLSSQVVTWSLATILSIVQPRLLGPFAQGQLRLAFSLWTIASVLIGLGTSLFLTLEVARHRRSGLDLLGPVLVIRSLAFIATSAVLAAFVAVTESDAQFALIMVLFGAMIFLASMSDAISAAFIGLERMSVLAKANIIARIVGTIVAVAVLLAGGTAVTVVAVGAAANLLALAILARALRGITTVSFRGWRSKSRMILRASVGFLVAGAVLTVYQQVDTVIMSLLVDRDALGWYGTADTLFGSLLFLPTIVMGSVFPVLGRLHQDDPAAIPPLVKRTTSSLLLATVPIGLGTAVVAFPLTPLLYGEDFRETGAVLFVLGPVLILTAGNVLFGTVALATGRQGFWTMFMVAAIVLTIPVDLLLVPWADRTYSNGAIGGAVAYLITESLLVVVGLTKVAPYLFDRTFVWRVARIGLAGALMFAASWPLRDRMLLVPIVVGVVVYVAAILALRVLDENDRRYVRGALARVGLRSSRVSAPVSPEGRRGVSEL